MQIKRLHPDAVIPNYAKPDDSGLDLVSVEDILIPVNSHKLVPTGIAVAVPEPEVVRTASQGYLTIAFEIQIRSRSGLALKHCVTVLNSPGTIDEGYRGEIKVILVNNGTEPFQVNKGDRIAQMVVCPIVRVALEEVQELSETERGSNGFGSTGV